ncbi:MAG: hypothetical protein ACP5NV_06330 [Candidatus Woesearchaeota archaeon]
MKKLLTMLLVLLALPVAFAELGSTEVVDQKNFIMPLELLSAPSALLDNPNDECLSGVPSIYYNGLWWAWGSPCSGGCSQTNPEFFNTGSSSNGWRYATENEWSVKPSAVLFSNSTGGVVCASSFFDPIYSHCDYTDGISNFTARVPNGGNYESWFVHDACVNGGGNGGNGGGDPQVPEFGVVAAGVAMIGAIAIFLVRRKN